jgi:hypothetical protein
MAPNKKLNAWLQRNAARVRIWVEEGVIDNAEANNLSQRVFNRMTAHDRAARTSRRVITPYDEGALMKFITTASEFLAREPHVPEVGQPGSDPPEPPRVDNSDDREGAVGELRMILRKEAEDLMEVDEHRYDHPFQWPSSPPTVQQQLIQLPSSPDLPAAHLLPAEDYDDWADDIEKASGVITSDHKEDDDADLYSRPAEPVFCQPPATQSRVVDEEELYSHSARPVFCPPPSSPASPPIHRQKIDRDDTPKPEPVDNGFRYQGVDHDIELYDLPREPVFQPPPIPPGNVTRSDADRVTLDIELRDAPTEQNFSSMRSIQFAGREQDSAPATPMEDVRGADFPISGRDIPMEDGFREEKIPLPRSGTARTIYPARPTPLEEATLPPPQQKPPSPIHIPPYRSFNFQTPGLQQFFTPRDFSKDPASSSPAEQNLFYRPPPSPSPVS